MSILLIVHRPFRQLRPTAQSLRQAQANFPLIRSLLQYLYILPVLQQTIPPHLSLPTGLRLVQPSLLNPVQVQVSFLPLRPRLRRCRPINLQFLPNQVLYPAVSLQLLPVTALHSRPRLLRRLIQLSVVCQVQFQALLRRARHLSAFSLPPV